MNGILLDLDGTLWDSGQAVADSWNELIETLPDVDIRFSEEDVHSVMGMTMDRIAYKLFPDVGKERAVEIMDLCADYENKYIAEHGGKLYEGLEDVLSKLSKEYFIAIVSNCQCGYIEAFLEYYGLGKYIDDTQCFGDLKVHKGENIALVIKRNGLDKAVYVGDTHGDYEASLIGKTGFILASYGFGSVPDAEIVINKLEELPKACEGYFKEEPASCSK